MLLPSDKGCDIGRRLSRMDETPRPVVSSLPPRVARTRWRQPAARAAAEKGEPMRRRRLVVALALILAALGLAAVAAWGSETSVTITSPKAGQSISLKKNPYLAVAGGVSFAAADPGGTTFYLRRDGCGSNNDNPHLSVTSGEDAGDGCGLVITVVGVGGDVDQGA